MRQRYGLAAAMLGTPELLVLDEPLSGIDVEGMDEITDLLKKVVARRGVTVLLSSHQLARLEQAMGPDWDQFVRYNERTRGYQMNLDKYKLLRDLGQCPSLFGRGDFLYCYEIPPERYPLDTQDIFEGWAVTGIFSDIGGSIFFWMFFAAFFFGRAHTKRGYTAGILCGVKRRDLILGL